MQGVRLLVMGVLWIGSFFLVLDRVNISLAAPRIMDALQFDGTQMGIVLSIYYWGYLLGHVSSGLVSDQVRLRSARWIDVGHWDRAPGKVGEWELLGRSLSQRLLLPSPRATVRLTNRRVLDLLVEGSGHRPGLAVVWAKRAASYAVWHDTDLDVTALEATHAGLLATEAT